MTKPGLFITSSRIGDAVMTLSLLEGLKTQHPNTPYVVAADPLVASLFHDDPSCTQIISFPKQKHSRHWWDLWKQTCSTSWAWIADTRGSIMSYGLRTDARYVWKKTPNDTRHKVDQVAGLGKLSGITPRIHISPERAHRMAQFLPIQTPIYVIAPVANWIGKQWPMDRFATIIQRICDANASAHILIIAAPSENNQLAPLRTLPCADRLIFSTDLTQTHRLTLLDMAALMQHGAWFLGNDSGLMHISYALGIPTFGLFGPSRDHIYGPYPADKHTVLRIPYHYDELAATPGFSHKSQDCYMLDLTVDTVWDAIFKRMRPLHDVMF